jgi:toxin YhaV
MEALFTHELFDAQLKDLMAEVATDKVRHSETWGRRGAAQRLRAVRKILRDLQNDPTLVAYGLGNTLGPKARHWRRVKFLQQFRLFFRFSQKDRIVLLVWFNDPDTLRAYESDRDAYRVFSKMLKAGHPPSDLSELMRQCRPLAEADKEG